MQYIPILYLAIFSAQPIQTDTCQSWYISSSSHICNWENVNVSQEHTKSHFADGQWPTPSTVQVATGTWTWVTGYRRCHWPGPSLSDLVATVTITDSKSKIESESVSKYAQAAQRQWATPCDDFGGRGWQLQGRGRALQPGFGAGCRGWFENPRREMQGVSLCPALEGRPSSAFIFGLYIQHNQCITHVAKSSVSNPVFPFVVQKQKFPLHQSWYQLRLSTKWAATSSCF